MSNRPFVLKKQGRFHKKRGNGFYAKPKKLKPTSLRFDEERPPLKFDDEDTLVFHLMIYDVESHINHVIQSPFTCFDWERSELYIKKKLILFIRKSER